MKKLKAIIAAVSLSFVVTNTAEAQMLRELGRGLPSASICTCADSAGNLYAVTAGDSIIVHRWEALSSTWTRSIALNASISVNQASCAFFQDKFFLTGIRTPDKTKFMMYELSTKWRAIQTFSYHRPEIQSRAIRYKEYIYFTGGFDTIAGAGMPFVAAYNGGKFSPMGFPGSIGIQGQFGSPVIKDDTLFIIADRNVIYHVAPDIWGIYYTGGNTLGSIAAGTDGLYVAMENSNRIFKIKGNTVSKGYTAGAAVRELWAHNGMVMAKPVHTGSNRVVQYLTGDTAFSNLFRNQLPDTNTYSFASGGGHLYYFGSNGVKADGHDLHYVGELFPTLFQAATIDTAIVKVYADHNHNYIFDNGDSLLENAYMSWQETGQGKNTDIKGITVFNPLNNERFSAIFSDGSLLDSCYRAPFSGGVSADLYFSALSRDTVMIPLWRVKKNLVLKTWSPSQTRARLLDTIVLHASITNQDCDTSKNNLITLTVQLDSNTQFQSSSPAYSSRTGNTLVYKVLTANAGANIQVDIKVIYPNTSYKIDDVARHYFNISTSASGEDSINNTDSIVHKMVYSYDPNIKYSIPEGVITSGLDRVRYFIQFQNEGNDEAVRVTVVDTLDISIPVYEYQMVTSSHPCTVSFNNNVVTWIFDNINLAPKSEDEAGSKGYLVFDAKIKSALGIGDSIQNKAYIYFDYNNPIITNTAWIKREALTNVPYIPEEPFILVYPNPARDYVTVKNRDVNKHLVTVYDCKGARVQSITVGARDTEILYTQSWAEGVYLFTGDHIKGIKLIVR